MNKYEENILADFIKKEQKKLMKLIQMQRG